MILQHNQGVTQTCQHSADTYDALSPRLIIRHLGLQPYSVVCDAMHNMTEQRDKNTPDELWLVEHPAVFTQGQAGKAEHLLMTGDIPVIQSDRGGQVTYHGPGQQILYVMIDLKRQHFGVRQLVTMMEQTVIASLKESNIDAFARADAPGVYVHDEQYSYKKICSLGLRIRQGRSFHGLALNVDMDLSPFNRINPCGYAGMKMTQMSDFVAKITTADVSTRLAQHFTQLLGSSISAHHIGAQPLVIEQRQWNQTDYE